MVNDPHGSSWLEHAGARLDDASVGLLFLHGRGARAAGIVELVEEIDRDDVAAIAPQAADDTWYPQSFLAPTTANEPYLSSALRAVADALSTLTEAGIDRDRIVVVGFSQGACLGLEFVARRAERYGGVVAFSGGLIGSSVDRDRYDGSLAGTPAFVGCGDRDPHIPVERVRETAAVLEDLEADVTERIYEGVGHTILEDELEFFRELVDDVAESAAASEA